MKQTELEGIAEPAARLQAASAELAALTDAAWAAQRFAEDAQQLRKRLVAWRLATSKQGLADGTLMAVGA